MIIGNFSCHEFGQCGTCIYKWIVTYGIEKFIIYPMLINSESDPALCCLFAIYEVLRFSAL